MNEANSQGSERDAQHHAPARMKIDLFQPCRAIPLFRPNRAGYRRPSLSPNGARYVRPVLSPNGATYASPGLRRNQHRALEGRHISPARSTRVVPPLQGSESRVAGDPGRCPGLRNFRPLALKMKIGGGR